MNINDVMEVIEAYRDGMGSYDEAKQAVQNYGRNLKDDGYEDGFEVATDAGVMGS